MCPRRDALAIFPALTCAALAGCATGSVKRVRVDALGADGARAVAVATPEGGDATTAQSLRHGLEGGLAEGVPPAGPTPAGGPGPAAGAPLVLRTHILALHERPADAGALGRVGGLAGGLLGSDFVGGAAVTVVEADLRLVLPDGRLCGQAVLRGVSNDALPVAAESLGREAGREMGALIARRMRQFVRREAGDDRMVLTPTALQLEAGDVQLSDDEVLFARLAVGLTDWLQLNLGAGGLALPVPAGALAGGGVVGGLDLGFKLRLLEEGKHRPGIAIGYDLVDFFAAGWMVLFLDRFVLPVAAAANIAFNLVSVVVEKHIPATGSSFTAGAYYLDANQTVPAGVAVAILIFGGAKEADRSLHGAAVFAGAHQHLWRWFSLAGEWFPGRFSNQGVASAVLRTVIRPSGRWRFLDAGALQIKLDAGAVTFYGPHRATASEPTPSGTAAAPLPWLSLGLYWM